MRKIDCENAILKEERVKYLIKGEEVETTEKYYINKETKERLYDRDISIENDIAAYDEYKKKKKLLTTGEIKAIRKKYQLNQKEYALAIGVGEITIHRFENGTIQTESIDSIMRLSDNPNNMRELVYQNVERLDGDTFRKIMKLLDKLISFQMHRIANINYEDMEELSFKTETVDTVAEAIIQEYNAQAEAKEKKMKIEIQKITPLQLQKYLYYVAGIALAMYGKAAFDSAVKAWTYGPVVEEIYHKYKKYGCSPINEKKKPIKTSRGMKEIIKKVVEGYGIYTGGRLIDLTHEEEPWKNTHQGEIINNEIMKKYFEKVYKEIV